MVNCATSKERETAKNMQCAYQDLSAYGDVLAYYVAEGW